MLKKIRVIEYARMDNNAGIENFLMNIYRNIDKSCIQIDFLRPSKTIGPFDAEILNTGSSIFYLNEVNKNIVSLFNNRNEFRRFLSYNNDIDVIHFHGNGAFSLLNSDIAFKYKIPKIIAHSHNNSVSGFKSKTIHNIVKKYISPFFTNRLACSLSAWNWMFDTEFNYKKDAIIYNGINTELYMFNCTKREEIRKLLDISDKTLVIGSVGRLTRQKNFSFMIKVLDALKYFDVKFVVVGDGELLNSLKVEAFRLNVEHKISFIGNVNNVQDYLSAFDLFVLPSIWEGLGICLIEAQASGLPCIVSNAIVPEAIVSDLVIRANINNINEWVNLVKNLSTNNRVDRVKYNSIVRDSQFNINKAVKTLERIYLSK